VLTALAWAGPTITSISPTSGPPFTQVTVKGSGFGTSQGTVSFNGVAGAIVSWTNTQILVDAPNGSAGSGAVEVNWNSSSFTFSFTPTINSISPQNVPSGQTVSVVGQNFGSATGSVTLAGETVQIVSWGTNSISIKVPANAPTGADPVIVTSSIGSSPPSTLNVQFAPSVSGISPIFGPPNTQVTVTGTGFGANTQGTVSFNGVAGTIVSWSDKQIIVTAPNGSAGSGPVVVSWQGVNSNSFVFNFLPTIFNLSPSNVGVGWTFSVVGQNFGSSRGTVTLNGSALTPSSWSTNSITIPVVSSDCTGPIVVTTAIGASNTSTLTVQGTSCGSAPLTVSASASPRANSAGWNNASVTVSFTCSGGVAPVTCPSPQTVSTQGANQVITGTAKDSSGATAQASITLNIDLTPPTLAISSPANGASFTSSPTPVSGTVSDALSGVASVTCDGAAATVQNGSYSCSVPLSAGTDTITVQATDVAGNTASQSVNATLIVPAAITSFSPSSATIGSLITVQGSGFAQTGFSPEITLNQEGGGTIEAPISSASSGTLSFVLPSGAASGPITITVDGLTTVSSSSLSVVSSSTFSLSAGPASVTLLPGQSAIVQVSLTSTNGFTQPAALSVSGLPSGITASFQPSQITEGGSSLLTLSAPSGQSPGSSVLTISASATVQGISQTETAQVSLNVQTQAGSASFAGRVAVTGPYNIPLVGVTVSFTGTNYTGKQTGCTGSTTTDNGGNFVLNGLSSSCTGSQMIEYDPSTVTSPPGKYSGVTLSYVITPGQTTTPGIVVHLPNVTNAETFNISQNSSQNQTFVSQTIPGVTITIYAGTTLSLADGTQPDPFPLSVIEIPYSQVPDYMPPNTTEDPVFAMSIEPFNSSSSQPIAVSYPNRKNSLPGSNMPLTSLNPTLGMMVNYGTGTVSPDMTQVVPDPDPANPGHLYGISHFDWHFPLPAPNPTNPSPDPDCPCAGDPVDFGSGILVETKTDIAFNSARGQIALTRTYREMAATVGPTGIAAGGPFGLGTNHNYNVFMDTSFVSTIPDQTSVVGLLMPDGNEFWFTGQLGQTFITSSTPTVAGATFSNIQCGGNNGYGIPCSGTLRWRDGTIYQFQPLLVGQPFFGFLMSITDPNGNVTTIVHDQSVPSEIDRIVDPVGRALTFGYDGSYRITSITDPIGRSVSYTYNSIGKLATVTDPKGGVTTYTYNALNQLSAVEDANGNTYQNQYDPNGRVIQQTAPDGGVTQFQYTLLNPNVATSPVVTTVVTDPRMNSTTYTFNPAGYLQSITDPMGNQTVYTVNSSTNQKTSVTDPLMRTTGYTYDSNGNKTSITLLQAMPSGESLGGSSLDMVGPTTTTYVYDPVFSKLTSTTDPLGNLTTYSYDGNGNLLGVKDPLGRQTAYAYDFNGEKVKFTDPTGEITQYVYSAGAISSMTDPMGRVSVYLSDGIGRQVSSTTPLGQTTQYQYDPLGKIVGTIDPSGHQLSYGYDANENLLSVTDPLGNTTKFSYSSMNRLQTRTDPMGHKETYQYDFNGNLLQFTDRRGTTSSFSYDQLNRKITANYGSGGTVNYYYDSVNRMTQAVDSITGPITRSYDLLDRMVLEGAANGSVSYAYDASGRRISMQVSGQPAVVYGYDNDNELLNISQNGSVVGLTYDQDGRRTAVTLPNGTVTSYGYDSDSELTAINYQIGSVNLGSLTYAYDADGHRTNVSGSLAQTTLPTAAAGGAVNGDNQLTQWNGSSFTYDANGNLLSDGTNTYTWDARNRLVTISGGVSASFKYDPFGRRVGKTVGVATTSYVYDGPNSVQELVGGLVSANMLSGLNIDEFFQRTDGSGTGALLRDALGSTVSIVGGTGSAIAQYTYGPFGNTTVTGTSTNSYQYTGRESDGTGLYYYRARYYNPQIGRFIGEDSARFTGGINFYTYAQNSPINTNDPLGLCNCIPWSSLSFFQKLILNGLSALAQRSGGVRAFGGGGAAAFSPPSLAGGGGSTQGLWMADYTGQEGLYWSAGGGPTVGEAGAGVLGGIQYMTSTFNTNVTVQDVVNSSVSVGFAAAAGLGAGVDVSPQTGVFTGTIGVGVGGWGGSGGLNVASGFIPICPH